jgi:hypothetical protein
MIVNKFRIDMRGIFFWFKSNKTLYIPRIDIIEVIDYKSRIK